MTVKDLNHKHSSKRKAVYLQGNLAMSFILYTQTNMLLLPNCKINLGLNVVSKRPDGYHNLETIFYPIPLRDNLEFKEIKDEDGIDFRLTQEGVRVEGRPEDNLVVKVFLSLKKEFDLPPLDIFLYKHIPMGAGLGGGSSDAAAMMRGLNEFFELGMLEDEMERRIASFGADCAFFIQNIPTYATGIGDILSPITLSLKDKYIVLVKPDVFISTKEAYAHVIPHPSEVPLLQAISKPINTWKHSVVNDFEKSVFPNHPELSAIKQTLYDMGALYAAMSGSGSTIFGIFDRPVPEAKKVFHNHFVFQQKFIR